MLTLQPQGSHFSSGSNNTTPNLQLISQPEADYTKESERFRSYINWPNKEIDPKRLAKAGFYYVGTADIVRCAFCGAEGYKWVRTDDPMEDHQAWQPSCSFVRRVQRTENNEQPQSPTTSAVVGQDTCGTDCIEIFPRSVADDELIELERYGATKTKGPRHKDQVVYETRLKTFDTWPKSMKQKPAELAEAGFFYRGTGDQTLCYHCGGGLNDWEETDDPWEQHALWFPKCNYLLLKKGKEFVDNVKTHSAEASSASSTDEEAKEPATSDRASPVEKESQTASSSTEEENTPSDTRLCKICFKNEMGVLFLPCGHIVACVDCATALSNCAVCRKKVEATVRAFLS